MIFCTHGFRDCLSIQTAFLGVGRMRIGICIVFCRYFLHGTSRVHILLLCECVVWPNVCRSCSIFFWLEGAFYRSFCQLYFPWFDKYNAHCFLEQCELHTFAMMWLLLCYLSYWCDLFLHFATRYRTPDLTWNPQFSRA